MYTKQTILKNHSGLHARPAVDFVTLAKTFSSNIFVKRMNVEPAELINAKSILNLLAQGLSKNTPIEITAEGVDEQEAVEQLIALIDEKFGED